MRYFTTRFIIGLIPLLVMLLLASVSCFIYPRFAFWLIDRINGLEDWIIGYRP